MKSRIAVAITALLLITYYIFSIPDDSPENAEELIGFNEDDARMATKDFYSVSPLPNETRTQQLPGTAVRQNNEGVRSERLGIEAVDSVVQKIVLDGNLARADKINKLWTMLEDQLAVGVEDLVSFEAIARGLATLWPIELTDKLIATAGDQSLPPKARLYLIEALVRATKMYTLARSAVDGPKDFSYIALNMENIRSFFGKSLANRKSMK